MERVAFLIEATNARIGCLLNPESVVMRRQAGVRARHSATGQLSGAGLSDDPLLYTGGGRTELDLDLLFDVSIAGSSISSDDVRDLTRPLWNLAENGPDGTGYGQPSLVRFIWGKSWNMLAVVVAVAERLEYFTSQGVPRRSWLRMRLWRVPEPPLDGGAGAHRASPPPEALLGLEELPFPQESVGVHEVIGGPEAGDEGTPTAPAPDGVLSAADIIAGALAATGAGEMLASAQAGISTAAATIGEEMAALREAEAGAGDGDGAETVPAGDRANAEAVEGEVQTILGALSSAAQAGGAAMLGAMTDVGATVSAAMARIGPSLDGMTSEAGQAAAGRVASALEHMRAAVDSLARATGVAARAAQARAAEVIGVASVRMATAVEGIRATVERIGETAAPAGAKAREYLQSASGTVQEVLEALQSTGHTVATEQIPAALARMGAALDGLWSTGEAQAARSVRAAIEGMALALRNVKAAAEVLAAASRDKVGAALQEGMERIRAAVDRAKAGEAGAPLEIRETLAALAGSVRVARLGGGADEPPLSRTPEVLERLEAATRRLEGGEAEMATQDVSDALDQVGEDVEAMLATDREQVARLIREQVTGAAEAHGLDKEARWPRAARGLGQRLDLLAFEYYRQPALWRLLANFNDIRDPLHVPAGCLLRVPPASW